MSTLKRFVVFWAILIALLIVTDYVAGQFETAGGGSGDGGIIIFLEEKGPLAKGQPIIRKLTPSALKPQ
ncbi:hypothetical protein BV898_03884 [Hypsibius exemplaris]|uniref:Uncharacterized protein n=1 Tax=Hypsibius exemplaris TaxID=2072580 RepID=A0A1W0X3A3_HYPEX|nr:hypothetical protein BV898_03884 [Hypsibius exemplaris]